MSSSSSSSRRDFLRKAFLGSAGLVTVLAGAKELLPRVASAQSPIIVSDIDVENSKTLAGSGLAKCRMALVWTKVANGSSAIYTPLAGTLPATQNFGMMVICHLKVFQGTPTKLSLQASWTDPPGQALTQPNALGTFTSFPPNTDFPFLFLMEVAPGTPVTVTATIAGTGTPEFTGHALFYEVFNKAQGNLLN